MNSEMQKGPVQVGWLGIVLATVFLVSMLAVCSHPRPPDPGASIKEFEKYSLQSYWQPARAIGFPESVPNFKVENHGQVHLISNDGQQLIRYTEFSPGWGLKSFYGLAALEPFENSNGPFFKWRGHTNRFVGFFDRRAFQIEILSWGPDPERTLQGVAALATQVLRLPAKSL